MLFFAPFQHSESVCCISLVLSTHLLQPIRGGKITVKTLRSFTEVAPLGNAYTGTAVMRFAHCSNACCWAFELHAPSFFCKQCGGMSVKTYKTHVYWKTPTSKYALERNTQTTRTIPIFPLGHGCNRNAKVYYATWLQDSS